MKKNTKKLLSLITAGLIALQSVPFMALGATAAEPAGTVKKGTPVIDGEMDSIWEDTAKLDTLVLAQEGKAKWGWNGSDVEIQALKDAGIMTEDGNGVIADADLTNELFTHAEISFLWDDNNLYIYSKVYDNDIILPTDPEVDTGITDIWDIAGTDWPWINEAVNHTISIGGTSFTANTVAAGACWDQNNCDGYGSGTCDTSVKGSTKLSCFVHCSGDRAREDQQYISVDLSGRDEGYYVIELAVPIADSLKSTLLADGAEFKYTYLINDAYLPNLLGTPMYDSAFTSHQAAAWMQFTGKANTLVMSAEKAVDASALVKKGTPVLDGKKDGIWGDTATIDTLADAQAGNGTLGWSAGKDLDAMVEAGIIDASKSKILADGDLTNDLLTHAEISFLWDDANLYLYAKVYDNDIVLPSDGTEITVADIEENYYPDQPWLNEGLDSTFTVDGTPVIKNGTYAMGFMWDTATCKPWPANNDEGCDDSTLGCTTIGCWYHIWTVDARANEENLAVDMSGRDEGYYTLEVRMPLTDAGKALFATAGTEFEYKYQIVDAYEREDGTTFDERMYASSEWNYFTCANGITLYISDAEAVCKHSYVETTVEATCDKDGYTTSTCELCGEEDASARVEIPAKGHNYVDGACDACGKAQPVAVKKGTPELDGKMDAIYTGSATIDTLAEAQAGNGKMGWSAGLDLDAMVAAGIIDEAKAKILADGDLTNDLFTHAEISLLWDDANLYLYAKVYDNDIVLPYDGTEVTIAEIAEFCEGQPWLNEGLNSNFIVGGTNLIANGAYAIGATWDTGTCKPWPENNEVGCDDSTLGCTTLGCWHHIRVWENRPNSENIAVDMSKRDNGYYSLEVRMPLSDAGKAVFATAGTEFEYEYTVVDAYAREDGTTFDERVYATSEWNYFTGEKINLYIADEEAVCAHVWKEKVVEATCDKDGYKKVTCKTCKIEDESLAETYPAFGHNYENGLCTTCEKKEAVALLKGTPVLDGVLDVMYEHSAHISTLTLAKNGEGKLGWSGSPEDYIKLADAGLIELEKNEDGSYKRGDAGVVYPLNMVNSEILYNLEGNFDIPGFTHADIYFLWDDDNLYIFAKVYDDDIVIPQDVLDDDGTPYVGDDFYDPEYVEGQPWLDEMVRSSIYVGGTKIIEHGMLPAMATWDTGICKPWPASVDEGCDDSTLGYTTLRCWHHGTMESRMADLENLAVDLSHRDEGYYTVEARIPLNEAGKEMFKAGTEFGYQYEIADGYDRTEEYNAILAEYGLDGPTFDARTYCVDEWMFFTGNKLNYFVLTDEAAPSEHVDEDSDAVCDDCGVTLRAPGDVNNDGAVDTKDLTRLMRAFAGEDVELYGPDVNGDGAVDTKDLTRLMRYFAGEDVELN